MIGPNKWRLLILYSAYLAGTSVGDDLRIEHGTGVREGKNLLPPFQPFSIVDNVRYTVDSSPKNEAAQFGSFRFVDRRAPIDHSTASRRSDILAQFPPNATTATTTNFVDIAANYRDNSTSSASAATTTTSHVVEIVESIDLTDSARRSGFKYPETTFVPQGYSEDHHSTFDTQAVRRPFFDNHNEFSLDDGNEHVRLVELFGGLANGGQSRNQIEIAAAESSVQPVRILPDQVAAEAQRLRSYPTIYYQNTNDYRSRHYFPPKPEFFGDFPVIKKFPSTWKSRTPRVIFPIPDLPTGPGSAYSTDSVVFKDQNFGLNELAAVQDIRNDFTLDDSLEDTSPTTTSAKDKGCGISLAKQTAQRRIVGGDDAGFGSYPWQAYIRIGSSRSMLSRCGGSLVSRRHVVTAGHCVARATPRQVHVTLGDYVINSAIEPLPAYTFGVRSIHVHPYFKFTPQADRFDVAVLTLERPVHYMPHIAPICLPEKNEDFLGKFGWAAGWGALNPGSRLRPKTLQAVDVPVIDNRVCERWHRSNGINVVIYPEMLCAGYRNGGKDSCQGDSGGPLMHEKSNRWYLIGIVSAGYSCASRGQPGIYHRVAHTVDWISHIINP